MLSEKVDQLIVMMEKQELETPSGISPTLYAEYFAAYLFKGDLCNARFLWKRIPQQYKSVSPELERMFKVWQCLWNNKYTEFHKAIKYDWSTHVSQLMTELKDRVHQETLELIGNAYSSIFENDFAEMTNQTPEDAVVLCKTLNWEIIEGAPPRLIIPKKPIVERATTADAEEQLARLTDFVSFLEN